MTINDLRKRLFELERQLEDSIIECRKWSEAAFKHIKAAKKARPWYWWLTKEGCEESENFRSIEETVGKIEELRRQIVNSLIKARKLIEDTDDHVEVVPAYIKLLRRGNKVLRIQAYHHEIIVRAQR